MSSKSSLGAFGALTLLSLSTLTIMVGAAIAPGLSTIASKTGLSEHSEWLITLPSLGVVITGPLAGSLLQKQGAKIAVLIGLILYGTLGVIGAYISNIPLLLLDRFFLGSATVLVMVGGTQLISEHFSGDLRLKMIAYQGMAIELGGVGFLALGGILANHHWRAPFGLYLVAFILFVIVVLAIPRSKTILTQYQEGEGDSEFRKSMEIFLASIASMVIFFSAFVTLPDVLNNAGYSESETGYYLASISFVAVLAAWFMPKLHKVLGPQKSLIVAFCAYAGGHACLALGISIANLVPAAILLGMGFGISIPLASIEVIERSSENKRMRNLAYLSSAIFLGQFLSAFLKFGDVGGQMTFFAAASIAIISGSYFAWPGFKKVHST